MSAVGLGLDIGTDSVKLALVQASARGCRLLACAERSHGKNPQAALRSLMSDINLGQVRAVAVTGRLGGVVDATRIPSKAALRKGLSRIVSRPERSNDTEYRSPRLLCS